MNTEQYEKYYSYDKLMDDVFKLEQQEIDKYVNLTNYFKPQQLFEFALDNALADLAEYLYIFYQTTMSINRLNGETVLYIREQSVDTTGNISAPLQTQSGVNSGIKLQYFDKANKKRAEMICRMNNLRKYSGMIGRNKDFFYTFKQKYINEVFK
jgi:hypothetical protein